MNVATIVALISIAAAVFLAWRRINGAGMPFERKARYAAIWAVLIIVIAFIARRMG